MLPAGVSLTSSVAIVEIIDNDEAPVPAVELGFDPVTYRVGEGSGTVELRVSVLSGDLTEPITLNYETSDGSAVAGTDYEYTTVTLSSGISSFTFTVNILEDLDNVDVELAGVFSVALSVVDMLPAGVSLTSSVAIVEIIDNDEAPVLSVELGFDPVTYRVGEGSGTVELRVSVLSGDLTEPITLNYETSDGSAVAGTDYEYTTGTLTLSSGISSFTFTVNILEDLDNVDVELAGVFTVALSVVDMLPAGVSLTSSVAIVEIIDNDEAPAPAVELGFDPVTYRVGEGSGTVELRVSVLSGDLTEPITLNYETSDGSAVAGTDYEYTTGTLTLSSGISSFTFTVKILEDLENVDVELAGVFTVALSVVDMLPAGVSLTSSVAIVEIMDNDEAPAPAVELGFDPVTYRVGEGSGTVELRVSVLSGDLTEPITLNYATSDGSAVAGTDYEYTTGTLTLSSGISSFTFTVKILEDLDNVDVELAGVFTVSLSVVDMLPAGVSLTSSVAIVEIIDNDEAPVPAVELGFDPVTYRVGEGSGTVELRVSVLSGDLTAPITLNYETSDGSAVAGTDYEYTTGTLILSSGISSFTFTVKILEDLDNVDVELAGVFTVALSVVDMLPAGVSLTSSVAIVEIIDNDEAPAPAVELGFDPVTYRVGEGSGTVELRVSVLSGDLTEPITLNYETSDGSAVAGTDYEYTTGTLTLSSGISSFTFTVKILEDLENVDVELAGVFTVSLSVVDQLPVGVSLTSSVAIVEIIDNDEAPAPAVELGFDPVTYRVGEGSGTVELMVSVLSGDLTAPITLNYATSDGSAVAGIDYEYTTGTLTLSSGISSFTFTVKILEDLDNVDVELAGVFSVALSVVDMLPAGVSLTSSVAIVEIIDNDEAPVLAVELGFDPVTYRVGEGSGTVELRVSVLSGVLTETIRLNYATSDGSAVAGTDYEYTTGTLILSSGISSFTFTVNILEDLDNVDVELAGVFTVALSVIDMLPAGVSLTSSVAIVEIMDNDEAPVPPVVVGFDPVTYRVGEGSGTVELRVSVLSGDLTEPITLNYETSDGSAVAGTDYDLTTGTLTLSSGISSFTFTVNILEDLDNVDVELAGVFTVSLSVVDMLPAGISLTSSVAIVEIIDNDEAPVPAVELGFDPVTYRVGEGSGTVELRVSVLSGVLTETIRLNYATSDGSAVAGTDYEYTTGTLTLSSGTSSFTFTVNILEDLDNVDVELAGVFTVSLSVVDMLPAGVSLTSSVAIVEIIDNDEAPVLAVELGFDPVTYRVGEGSGTVELRVSVLSGDLTEPITLNYATSDGSAVAGTDYEYTTGTLILSSGISSFTFTVKILEDLDNVDVELAGVFSVALSVVDMLPAGVSLTSSVAIVEIIDNDEAPVPAVELGFDPVTYRVGEGSGTVELRVSVLSGVLTETITLNYATSDGSAVAGTDYEYTTGTLTLSSGTSSFTFTVNILEDLDNVDVELAGVFTVSLSVVDMLPAGVSLTSSVAIVEIIDNDEAPVPAVELGFDPVTYRVGEGSGTVELRVSVLSGDLTEPITLNYATSDGSAVAGTDYEYTTGTLILSSGITSFTFTVKILEDLDNVDVELAGVFSVALSVVDMLPAGVSLTSSVAIVEIIDNDEAPVPAVELGFDPVTYRVGEGSGTVELMVSVLSGDLTAPITLNYETSDGSAVAGTDYEYTTGTLTLSSGISSFTFTVKILEDLDNVDVELAGVFTVALSVVDNCLREFR